LLGRLNALLDLLIFLTGSLVIFSLSARDAFDIAPLILATVAGLLKTSK
jgi:hypothetical protein